MDEIITKLFETGVFTDAGLSAVIIAMIIFLYKYVLEPMQTRIQDLPTRNDLKELIDESNEIEELNLEELTNKLNEISESLKDIEGLDRGSYRSIKEIRKDVDEIKTLLVQFQGHMMYNKKDN